MLGEFHMTKRVRRGISAPLGVIFGVLLAIILVILAVFIAFNISTSTIKSQSAQISVVGTPVLFYNPSTLQAESLTFVVYNPTEKTINVRQVIVKGQSYDVTNGAVQPKKSLEITVNMTANPVTLDWTEVYRGYVEFTIITDTGSLAASAQPVAKG